LLLLLLLQQLLHLLLLCYPELQLLTPLLPRQQPAASLLPVLCLVLVES
jgi:hypothetical protein